MTMSPLQIANERAFSIKEEGPAFAFIRDANLELLSAGKESNLDPCLRMAAFALAGFGDQILEDLTRAVPWDEQESLGETRTRALSLLQSAFKLLEDANADKPNWGRFFCGLGDIRSQYELLIDDLNSQDRELLVALPETLT